MMQETRRIIRHGGYQYKKADATVGSIPPLACSDNEEPQHELQYRQLAKSSPWMSWTTNMRPFVTMPSLPDLYFDNGWHLTSFADRRSVGFDHVATQDTTGPAIDLTDGFGLSSYNIR